MAGSPGCQHCGRLGWVEVQPGYGAKQFPMPTELALASLDDPILQAHRAAVVAQQQALDDSVYPCRACCPDQFFRWLGHHFDADHNRHTCEDEKCQLIAKTATHHR